MRIIQTTFVALLVASAPAVARADQGILILAPSGNTAWNSEVAQLAAKANAQKPTELVLGTPTHAMIEPAVDRLAKRGATDVTAVPFFLSVASPELTTGYALPLRLASSPETDPVFGDVILSRVREISRSPSDETILLMGSDAADGTPSTVNFNDAARRLNQMREFSSILVVNDLQDAKEQQQVRYTIEKLVGSQRRVLIIPVVALPKDGDTNLEQCLQGYSHDTATSDIISDARLVEWVLSRTAGPA